MVVASMERSKLEGMYEPSPEKKISGHCGEVAIVGSWL